MKQHSQSVLKSTLISRKPERQGKTVIAICLLVIFLFSTIYWKDAFGLRQWLWSSQQTVFEGGEVWRLFTAVLVHSDLGHFLGNSLLFGIFGYMIYAYFGLRAFPLTAFLAGGLINFLSLMTYDPKIRLIGASGVVYYLVGFWLVLYHLIQRGLSLKRRVLNTSAVTLVLLIPETFKFNVSYRTHAIGFAVGLAFGAIFFIRNKEQIRKKEIWERTAPEDDEEEFQDEIEEKIDMGSDSISPKTTIH